MRLDWLCEGPRWALSWHSTIESHNTVTTSTDSGDRPSALALSPSPLLFVTTLCRRHCGEEWVVTAGRLRPETDLHYILSFL